MIDKKLVLKQIDLLKGQLDWLVANIDQIEIDKLHEGVTAMRFKARQLCRGVRQMCHEDEHEENLEDNEEE